MKRSATLGMLAAAACLLPTTLHSQSVRGLTPADTKPSLAAPPTIESQPRARIESQPLAEKADQLAPRLERALGAPAEDGLALLRLLRRRSPERPPVQPATVLRPIEEPRVIYSRTYVPSPPTYRYEGQPVVFSRPIVYQRPVSPVVPPPPQYYVPPVLPIGGAPAGATIGRGVLGQPTVYVPGQPVRNVLRYLSP